MAHNKTLAAQLYQEFRRFFPRQRRRVLRQLLRLLPAGSLRAGHRHLHREGSDDQRRDRPDAAVGDPVALRAARRHHRRQRVVHLRPRLAGGLLRHAAAARARPADRRASRSCASWWRSSTSATTTTSARGTFRVRGDIIEVYPSYEEQAVRIELFGDEVDELVVVRPADRRTLRAPRQDRDLPEVALRHAARAHAAARSSRSRTELAERRGAARVGGQAARGAAPRTSGRCSTSR